VGRDDRRLAIGLLCGLVLAIALALVIGRHVQPPGTLTHWSRSLAGQYWPHIWHFLRAPGRKGWATIVQFFGALVAAVGFGTAYLRARYELTVEKLAKRVWVFIQRLWARLLGRPQQPIHTAGDAQAIGHFEATGVGMVTFNLNTSLRLQEQVRRLAQFVNARSAEAAQMESMIVDLRRNLAHARQATSELESRMLTRIQNEIRELQRQLDTVQVLDLRWAIGGLFITVLGIVLGYGT
jgi:4-amino-4-deoxy-L-arabinose transferase-like glycosyltransferase